MKVCPSSVGVVLAAAVLAILAVRCCSAANHTNTDAVYAEEDEYDYKEYEEDASEFGVDDIDVDATHNETDVSPNTTTPIPTIIHDAKLPVVIASATESVTPRAPCPSGCRCTDDTTEFINCTALGLTAIPALPANVLQLDLSHNRIAAISPDTFANTPLLRHLQLQHNQLTSIDSPAFGNASRLDHIDLSSNRIRHIDADAVAVAPQLAYLSLANNPLVLDEHRTFLNAPDLHTLDLEACHLTNVYNATFRNLTGLVSLNLRNNTFGEDMNVAAFANMTNLEKLRLNLTGLPRTSVGELCDTLEAIDIISSDRYDLSCFVLVSGRDFEDSTNTPATPRRPKIVASTTAANFAQIATSTARPPAKTVTTATPATTATTSPSATSTTGRPAGSTSRPAIVSRDGGADNATEVRANGADAAPAAGDEQRINTQRLRHILIGTIAVAIVGLAIGICFRLDLLGVKTKLCRTRTRGPAATDQVRPAEQVPLKDIELREIKQQV